MDESIPSEAIFLFGDRFGYDSFFVHTIIEYKINLSLKMKILLNNRPHHVDEGITLNRLASHLNLPELGITVAIDSHIIPRQEWFATEVEENAELLVLKSC